VVGVQQQAHVSQETRRVQTRQCALTELGIGLTGTNVLTALFFLVAQIARITLRVLGLIVRNIAPTLQLRELLHFAVVMSTLSVRIVFVEDVPFVQTLVHV